MILKDRVFEKPKGDDDVKKIYIFCEDARTELYYFC